MFFYVILDQQGRKGRFFLIFISVELVFYYNIYIIYIKLNFLLIILTRGNRDRGGFSFNINLCQWNWFFFTINILSFFLFKLQHESNDLMGYDLNITRSKEVLKIQIIVLVINYEFQIIQVLLQIMIFIFLPTVLLMQLI